MRLPVPTSLYAQRIDVVDAMPHRMDHAGVEQTAAEAPAPVLRVNHDLTRGAAGVARAVRHGVRVSRQIIVVECEHRRSQVIAAAQAKVLVLAQRLVPVSDGGSADELLHRNVVAGIELRGDVNQFHTGNPRGVSVGARRE